MSTFEHLDFQSQIEVDRYCDQYQSEVRSGKRPSIAAYLHRIQSSATKAALFRELLTIELDFGSTRGQTPDVETLRQLVPPETIPDQDDVVLRVANDWSQQDTSRNAPHTTKVSAASDELPDCLGHYQLLELIGSGAFGDVWKAHDAKLDRVVAIKTPRRRWLKQDEIDRFSKEAQVAARLKHPNIVAVHEIGQHRDRHFIVSEFVAGVSLEQWRQQSKPSFSEIVQACVSIASALQHAHDKGVVHRDLKPTNILIDSTGHPVITDFGLAKVLADETITVQGNLLGSPAYMPPEQARGQAFQSDPRSDIYSLGVILYELLSGERPFRGTTESVMHQAIHADPTAPRKLNASIPRDLETICLKCMAKEPGRRYQSAADLLADLRYYAKGQPIRARPVSTLGRCWLCTKRNPTISISIGLAFICILVLAIGGPILASKRAAEIRHQQRQLYVADMILAQHALDANNLDRTREILAKYQADPALGALRSFEWFYLLDRVESIGRARLRLGSAVFDLAVSPDGQLLATAGAGHVNVLRVNDLSVLRQVDHPSAQAVVFDPVSKALITAGVDDVRIWHPETGDMLRELPSSGEWSVATSLDGAYLAVCGCKSKQVTLWNMQNAENRLLKDPSKSYYDLAFSPKQDRLAATSLSSAQGKEGDRHGTVTIWNLDEGQAKQQEIPIASNWARQVAFSPDGTTIAVTTNKHVLLFDSRSGDFHSQLPFEGAESVSFSPDGSTLASGSWTGTVKVWDLQSRSELTTLRGHSCLVDTLVFTPVGELLSVGHVTGEIIIWGVPTRETGHTLASHDAPLNCLVASPDNRIVASVGDDGLVVFSDLFNQKRLRTSQTVRKNSSNGNKNGVTVSGDGQFAALIDGQSVIVQSLLTGVPIARLDGHGPGLTEIDYSPVANMIAISDSSNTIRLWNVANDSVVGRHLAAEINSIDFDPTGAWLAVAAGSEVVCLDSATLDELYRCSGHEAKVYDVAFSVDGWLGTASRDATIRLWRADDGQLECVFPTQGGYVLSLAFSPDGKTLASGSVTQIKLWNMATRAETITIADQVRVTHGLAFADDGQALFSASFDGNVRMWKAPLVAGSSRYPTPLIDSGLDTQGRSAH